MIRGIDRQPFRRHIEGIQPSRQAGHNTDEEGQRIGDRHVFEQIADGDEPDARHGEKGTPDLRHESEQFNSDRDQEKRKDEEGDFGIAPFHGSRRCRGVKRKGTRGKKREHAISQGHEDERGGDAKERRDHGGERERVPADKRTSAYFAPHCDRERFRGCGDRSAAENPAVWLPVRRQSWPESAANRGGETKSRGCRPCRGRGPSRPICTAKAVG